jgi:hypothetical protein
VHAGAFDLGQSVLPADGINLEHRDPDAWDLRSPPETKVLEQRRLEATQTAD